LKRTFIIAVLTVLAAGALVYVCDSVSLRYRIPNNRARTTGRNSAA
jgi:hypothetical protein